MPGKDPFHKRIHPLNDKTFGSGDVICYWMQQSQRVEYNHALAYAVEVANSRNLSVLVVFGLMGDYPEANTRHYRFMLEGLKETSLELQRLGIRMLVRSGHPVQVALAAAKGAAMVVTDMGYLRHQRLWREEVARKVSCRMIQVESDAIVPVAVASDKKEYGARTIRPKIHRSLPEFLVPFQLPLSGGIPSP